MEPLASSPSPLAFIKRLPPLIVILPSDELIPSSLETTLISPSLITMSSASRPS